MNYTYGLILLLCATSLTGCAHSKLSDYEQGCRDGIYAFVEQGLHAGIEDSVVETGCDGLARSNRKK